MKDVIGTLEDLIGIDSINPFVIEKADEKDSRKWRLAGNENTIAEYLGDLLGSNGFKVTRQPVHRDVKGREFYNVLGEKGIGNKSILFYGHMDTVTANPWKSQKEALTPTRRMRRINGIEEETIVGLGSNDMKAGIAAIACAFRELNPKGYNIKVAFGVDEEFYSLGANTLAPSGFMDDVQAIVIPEVGDGPNKCFGPSSIMLGRRGRCEYVIEVPGTGGHGAQANNPNFVDAGQEVTKILSALYDIKRMHKDSFRFYNGKVPDESATNETEGSFFMNQFSAGSGSLSVPSEGSIVVDWSFTPNSTIRAGQDFLNSLIDKMYADETLRKTFISGELKKVRVYPRLRPTPASDAYLTPENHPFTQFARESIDRTVGFMNFSYGYSVADENVFKRVRPEIPVLVIGPVGEDCHKADEWVGVRSVRELEKVYTEIAKNFGWYSPQV